MKMPWVDDTQAVTFIPLSLNPGGAVSRLGGDVRLRAVRHAADRGEEPPRG